MKRIVFILLLAFSAQLINAQSVGIGTASPNASAQLDVTSTAKGLLIPRMTGAQRSAIAAPAIGLLVFQTNTEASPASSPGLYLYEQPFLTGLWRRIARTDEISTSTWTVSGNNQYSNVAGNVGIGTSSPTERLDVNGNIRSRNNLIVDNNLTVGSQITAPLFKLHVYDDIGVRSTSTSGAQINFEDAAGINKNFINITGNDMKIGTLSSNDNGKFIIRTNGNDRLFIDSAGNITVGSAYKVATGYKMSVNGKIMCEELRVQLDADWPDYVFDDQYTLLPLESLQKKVMKEKHLPGIPSAEQVKEANGIDVGDMQKRLLEKMEEMYRYLFQLNNENQQLKKEIELLKNKK